MPPAAAGKPYEINSYENKPRFVSTDHDKRGPRTRMGAVGRHPFFGRRLHRPSGIRRGGDRPPSGSRRVSCSDRAAAQLAGRSARLHQTRRTAALLRRLGRVDGFDGQPLHGQPAPSEQRRLYARRQRFTLLRIASIARERSNPVTQSEYSVKLCPDINRLYISAFSPDSPNHNFKVSLSSSESC